MAPADRSDSKLRLAVVGMSHRQVCGVRDHAQLLAGELECDGARCSLHWLSREQRSLRGSRAEVRRWTRSLRGELAAERPDAILLHYSVFAYSFKGLPLFVGPTLRALRGAGVPVVGFLHELAYPSRRGGWRGAIWASSQRALLLAVMRACSGAIVTEDNRAEWVRTRPWLPRRTVLVAPVFSNLPQPSPSASRARDGAAVGVFGYASQGVAVALVLDTVAELRARGVEVQLRMLGAPGAASAAGERWSAAAAQRGLGDAVAFSGSLPAQELADALAACELLLFSEAAGPTSRKGTLAGALASGTPIVAIDGRLTWMELARADALRLAPPDAGALADVAGELLGNPAERDLLGARGRAFAAREMSVKRSAQAVLELLRAALPR
jgi:glycosyltransferase involved in cell wall biosynthesis